MFSFAFRQRGPLALANPWFPIREVSKQTRINRRLRKYRMDKIQKESSFNKQEGK